MDHTIETALFSLQDLSYRDFQSKLIPTVKADTVIGVRIPALRQLSRSLKGTPEAKKFLQTLPHRYYDENNLHALLIVQTDSFESCIAALERFLPFIDNWATCDILRPKCFKKHPAALLEKVLLWLASPAPYTRRFALEMLMLHFMDTRFSPEYLALAAETAGGEYYIDMMKAWYFATALTKQYESALPYLQQHLLTPQVHNKAIQKACESLCIPQDKKEYLKALKITGMPLCR